MKIPKILTALCLLSLLFGCKESDDYTDETGRTKFIEATAPVFVPVTRASDGDVENTIYWDNTDLVAVNSLKSSRTRVDAYDPSKAEFAFNVALPTPYCGVFLYSAYASYDNTKKAGTVSLPDNQYCNNGAFDSDAAVMLGYSDKEGELQFHHALAFIRLTVNPTTTTGNIKKITVADDSGNAMSGTFDAVFSADSCYINSTSTDGSAVTVNCQGEGLELGQSVIIAIPARDYKGITFSVVDENADFMKMDMKNLSLHANQGMVYPLSINFEPGAFFGTIESELDWNSFAAKAAKGYTFEGDTVRLLADINADDLDMVSGTFKGVFLGGGHTITQNANTKPLFEVIGEEGKVSGLKADGSFSSFAYPSQSGNAVVAMNNLGTIDQVEVNCPASLTVSDDLVLGSIAAQNGGVIENCTNKGDAVIMQHVGKTILTGLGGGISAYGNTISGIGDITGLPYSDASCHAGKFINCTNSGKVQVSVTGDGYNLAGHKGSVVGLNCYGGICGIVTMEGAKLESCNNQGSISRSSVSESSSSGASAVGGIVGSNAKLFTGWSDREATLCYDLSSGYSMTVKDCSNTGTLTSKCCHSGCITNDKSGARVDYVGGIVGLSLAQTNAKTVISSCTNTGSLVGGWSSAVNTVVLGGIAGGAGNTSIDNSTVNASISGLDGTAVGAAGGFVAFAKKNVVVSGGSKSYAKFNITKPNDDLVLLWGLAVGNIVESVSIENVKVGGEGTAGSRLFIDGSNFSNYLYNKGTKVRPQTSGVSYWSGK